MSRFGRKRPFDATSSNFTQKRDIWGSNEDNNSTRAGYGGFHANDAGCSSAEQSGEQQREQTFPTELVAYLRNLADTWDGTFDPLLLEKCLEECQNHEGDLCFFQESGRLVETLFAGHPTSALAFLVRLQRLKRKRRLELLTAGCASRVIERLMCALADGEAPLSTDAVESLADWTALLAEEWMTVVTSQSGAHVVRSLARLLCGLQRNSTDAGEGKRDYKPKPKPKATLAPNLEHHFRSLLSRALDWNLMKDVMRTEAVSCLMQDFVELDHATKSGQLETFLNSCYNEQEDAVLATWRDKQSSRIWEKIVEFSSEDVAERIYQSILQGQLTALALNRFANFPIQRLVGRAKSTELITDVLDELLPSLTEIASAGYYGVICAMCAACERADEDVQESFLKLEVATGIAVSVRDGGGRKHISKHEAVMQSFQELRSVFGCSKKADKTKFLAHVLCLSTHLHHLEQTGGKVFFDVNATKLQGSLLVQSLFRLKRHRTLLAGLFDLSPSTLLDLAKHPSASHIFDAFLASKTIAAAEKKRLVALFAGSWCTLASDKFGSRLVDSCWKHALDMDGKRELANELSRGANDLRRSPIGRLIYKKYELELFASDAKGWKKSMDAQEKKVKLLTALIE